MCCTYLCYAHIIHYITRKIKTEFSLKYYHIFCVYCIVIIHDYLLIYILYTATSVYTRIFHRFAHKSGFLRLCKSRRHLCAFYINSRHIVLHAHYLSTVHAQNPILVPNSRLNIHYNAAIHNRPEPDFTVRLRSSCSDYPDYSFFAALNDLRSDVFTT